jgi:S-adenosylmethionine:tRNA ribosyltransferase-isomerase
MRTSDFDYYLPPELIAQAPLEPRDSSRLLTLERATGQMSHRRFYHILDYLRAGDVMVFNQSRVIPARLYGRRKDTGGKVELLLLRRESPGVWQALGKPGRRLRPGAVLVVEHPDNLPGSASGEEIPLNPPLPKGDFSLDPHPNLPPYQEGRDWLPSPRGRGAGGEGYSPPFVKGGGGDFLPRGGLEIEVLSSSEEGIKRVRLSAEEGIDQLGEVPLPPYIHQRLADPERYQTVYSRQPGSVAAPTAGLHFTGPLLERIKDAGVGLAFITLHVGLDTFRPVHGEDPSKHQIHTEYYEVSAETADILNRARQEGRRIIAVGTTSVRVLEQVAQNMARAGRSEAQPTSGQADLYILPGHQFRMVDAIITNFHLPRSTLLMLVSAFAGRELILQAYQEAIEQRYRFYSFGDAMFIW